MDFYRFEQKRNFLSYLFLKMSKFYYENIAKELAV